MQESAEVILARLQTVLLDGASSLPPESMTTSLRAMERRYGPKATHYGRLLADLTEGSYAWDLFDDLAFAQAAPDAPPVPRAGLLSRCEPLLHWMRESGELDARERLLAVRDADLRALWSNFSLSDEDQRLDSDAIYARYFEAVFFLSETYRAQYHALRRREAEASPLLAVPRVRTRPLLLTPPMRRLFDACHEPASDAWDEMAWDVAALAVSAFFVRTTAETSDAGFPFWLEDYFQWRGVDPRKRTAELRRQIAVRIETLCENSMPGEIGGPLLTRRSRIFRRPASEKETPDGYLLLLGEWARGPIEKHILTGVFVKRLAEYDLGRQQWERRIGWFLAFYFHEMKTQRQTALTMREVLAGGRVAWEDMARTNSGKVVRQWNDALETLRRDKILESYACLDGPADGSDLPARGRLTTLLERRYQFTPGPPFAVSEAWKGRNTTR